MPVDESILGREWTEAIPPQCPKCGYNLTGISSTRCPECGHRATLTELRRNAQEALYAARGLRSFRESTSMGFRVWGAGLFCLVLTKATGVGGIGVVLGFLSGLAATGLGLQTHRAKFVSPEALVALGIEVDDTKGRMLAFMGVGLMLGSIMLAW